MLNWFQIGGDLVSEQKYAWLFHGEEGSGKSFMVASALVDVFTGKVKRNGVVLDTEGRLSHLNVPPEMIVSMRPDYGKPEKLVGDVRKWLRDYRRSIDGAGIPHDVIGVDSITENQFLLRLGMAVEMNKENPKEDDEVLSPRGWGLLGDRLGYDIGYMHPTYTKAHLLVTAYSQDNSDNPTALDVKKRPSLQGQIAKRIGKYFDFMVYVEKKRIGRGDNAEVVHRYHFKDNGDFVTKNILEHRKLLPPYLDGTADEPLTFDMILAYIN